METLTLAPLYVAITFLLLSVFQQILSWNRKKPNVKPKFPGPKQYPLLAEYMIYLGFLCG